MRLLFIRPGKAGSAARAMDPSSGQRRAEGKGARPLGAQHWLRATATAAAAAALLVVGSGASRMSSHGVHVCMCGS